MSLSLGKLSKSNFPRLRGHLIPNIPQSHGITYNCKLKSNTLNSVKQINELLKRILLVRFINRNFNCNAGYIVYTKQNQTSVQTIPMLFIRQIHATLKYFFPRKSWYYKVIPCLLRDIRDQS